MQKGKGENAGQHPTVQIRGAKDGEPVLELPVLFDGLDGPLELFAQGLGEEPLNGHIELLAEDDREPRINIVLERVS